MKSIRNNKNQKGFSDWRAWPWYGVFTSLGLLGTKLYFIPLFLVLFAVIAPKLAKEGGTKDAIKNYDQVVQEWHDMFKVTQPFSEWRLVKLARCIYLAPAKIRLVFSNKKVFHLT